MRARHLPIINLRYWLGITLASVFGTNLGDFYAHKAALGILPGLGVLAVLCAIVFIAEHIDQGVHELYYWLVIIIIRTGATNIADETAYRLKVPEFPLNAGLMILLAALAMLQLRSKSDDSVSADRLPSTGTPYWIAMLTAGVLGTVLGDVCEHAFGKNVAAVGLSAALVGVLLWRRSGIGALYWLIVAVARTAGTAVGDWIAENHFLNLGLTYSTLITGSLFTGVLLAWRPRSTRLTAQARS